MNTLSEIKPLNKCLAIIFISLLAMGFTFWLVINKRNNITNKYRLPDGTYHLVGTQLEPEMDDVESGFKALQIDEKLITGNYTHENPENESISIDIGKYIEDYPIQWVEGYGNHLPYQLVFVFPITILNYGDQPFTIIDYEWAPFNCAFPYYTFRGKDGDMGLYKSPYADRPEYLPISIDAGKGLTLFLKTAIAVDWTNLTTPEDKISKENPTLFDLKVASTFHNRVEKFESSLGTSYDFWGNKTMYGVGVRGIAEIGLLEEDSIFQPVYSIRFSSQKGNDFEVLFAPYDVRSTYPFKICEDDYYFDRNDEVFQIDFDEKQRYFE